MTGRGRGRLVTVDAGREHFGPIYHPANGFLSWYEEWLDLRARGSAGRVRNDFDRSGAYPTTVLEHPDVDEAVWAARMIGAWSGSGDHDQLS
ncbi:hypothetical protein, partial [Actinomadura sp. HBU206391]|uniref:hypothetical protein n=1 Tax=Actinomadura sp. HBU206391 TaxID=2731692 RepID=UPI001C9CF008